MRESTVGDENYEACGIVSSHSLFQWLFLERDSTKPWLQDLANAQLSFSSELFCNFTRWAKAKPSAPPPPLFCSGKFDKGGVRGGLHARAGGGQSKVLAKASHGDSPPFLQHACAVSSPFGSVVCRHRLFGSQPSFFAPPFRTEVEESISGTRHCFSSFPFLHE